MRVLALDTAAKRMGWAVLEEGPVYIASGVEGLVKGDTEKFQAYRLRLIDYWAHRAFEMFAEWSPDFIANETLPLIGGGGAAGAQSFLGNAAITALQTAAAIDRIIVKQVGATTVKARIGGGRSATKVKVRNGVIALLPDLAERKSSWTKVFDEPDAIAVGLTALGYRN